MARKTVNVDQVRESVNTLMKSDNVSDEYRLGAASVLEHILHETGNYNGYSYLGVEFPKDADPVIPNLTKRVYF